MAATCRSCRAPVLWVETQATGNKPGRKMPLDADRDGRPAKSDKGNIVFVPGATTGEGTPIVRYVPAGPGRYVSHFASCPNAQKHRNAP